MVLMLPFAMQFKDLFKCVCFLYVKANSKEICEEISFPSFLRKMLMSAFLLRFKANYLEKMRGYPYFSLWIPISLAKIYFFRMVLTWRKNLCIQQAPSLKCLILKQIKNDDNKLHSSVQQEHVHMLHLPVCPVCTCMYSMTSGYF